MIIAAEKTRLRTGYAVKNESEIGPIRSIMLTAQDFSFASQTLFEDFNQWIADIKADNIQVLKDLKQIENTNEETEFVKSDLDFEYAGKPGKYRFTLRANYVKEYHEYIKSFSGRDLRCFIADRNNHIHAYLSGSSVVGLDVELIHVSVKNYLGTNEPAWTIIYLVLSDPTQHNLVTQMDWNPNRFNLIHVTLTDISGDSTYLDFTIKDSEFGIPINNLYLDDIGITDNAGGISAIALTEKGCGQYRVTGSDSLTYGILNIDSDHFYGSGSYFVSQNTVIFNNYDFDTDNKFRVDVRYSGNSALYTGLVLADFTLLDDTNGAVSITSVTEVSTGRYEIVTSTDLTTGDISVDDGTVTGSGEYELAIEVLFNSIGEGFFTNQESNNISFVLITKNTLQAVAGLAAGSFTLLDDNNGTITVNSLTEPPGTYQLELNGARTSGVIELLDSIYFGEGNYEFDPIEIVNGGSSETTDFADTNTDGLADNFTLINSSNCSASIGAAQTGFTGSYQKVLMTGGALPVGIYTFAKYFKTGIDYKLRFKFYSQGQGTGADRFTQVQIYGSSLYMSDYVEHITGYYTIFESDSFQISAGEDQIRVQFTFNKVGMTIYLDEIELIEV